MTTIGPATLFIGGLDSDQNGEVVRVSIQQGREIIARFELPNGDFLKAIRGRVTPIELISREKL